MPGEENRLGRWSRRKLAAKRGAAAPRVGAAPAAPTAEPAVGSTVGRPPEPPVTAPPPVTGDAAPSDAAGRETAGSAEPEAPDAAAAASELPDIESLDYDSDFKPFLRAGVPEALKRLALRQLWRSNPVLANLDGLVDYGEDFTDAATVIQNLQTGYRVGRGWLTDEEVAAQAARREGRRDDAEQVAEADAEVAADEAASRSDADTGAEDQPDAQEPAETDVAKADTPAPTEETPAAPNPDAPASESPSDDRK